MQDFRNTGENALTLKASQYLTDAGAILKKLGADPQFATATNASTLFQAEITQLVLQFRIDTQNALAKLLKIEHGLLNILGINEHVSSMTNIERMKYALGSDDLKNILHLLNQLVHALLMVANRYQQNLKNQRQKKQLKNNEQPAIAFEYTPSPLEEGYSESLQTAIVKQSRFVLTLDEIIKHLEEWDKLEPSSERLNYIAALRGPISEYFQQLFENLEVTYDIYGRFALGKKMEENLSRTLNQVETLLKQIVPIYQPAHFFADVKTTPPHRLEERAAAKRLSNFFNR